MYTELVGYQPSVTELHMVEIEPQRSGLLFQAGSGDIWSYGVRNSHHEEPRSLIINEARLTDGQETPPVPQTGSWYELLGHRDRRPNQHSSIGPLHLLSSRLL